MNLGANGHNHQPLRLYYCYEKPSDYRRFSDVFLDTFSERFVLRLQGMSVPEGLAAFAGTAVAPPPPGWAVAGQWLCAPDNAQVTARGKHGVG
jgi:hypothetical protein